MYDYACQSFLLLSEFEAGKLTEAEFVLQLLLVQEERQGYVILLGFGLENVAEYDRLNAGPLDGSLVQHLLEQGDEVLADEIGVLRDLVVQDLALELVHLGRRERVAQAAQFVEDDAEGPDVRCRTVLWVLPELGSEVEGRADARHLEVLLSRLLRDLRVSTRVGCDRRLLVASGVRGRAGRDLGLESQLLGEEWLLLTLVQVHKVFGEERRIPDVIVERRAVSRCLLEQRVDPLHILWIILSWTSLLKHHTFLFRRLLLTRQGLLLRLGSRLAGLGRVRSLLLVGVGGLLLGLIVLKAAQIANLGVVFSQHKDV